MEIVLYCDCSIQKLSTLFHLIDCEAAITLYKILIIYGPFQQKETLRVSAKRIRNFF